MKIKFERNIIGPKQIERPWKKARDWTGREAKRRHRVLPAMEFTDGFRPNWELPVAPAMSGLFVAHCGL